MIKRRRSFRINNLKIWFIALMIITLVTMIIVELKYSGTVQPIPVPARNRFLTIHWDDGRRLGNILFNYAALRGIAERNNFIPLLEDHFPLKSWFNLSAEFMPKSKFSTQYYFQYEEFGRRACAYDNGIEKLPHKSTKLYGFFQSWRYFKNVEKQLHVELKFIPSIHDAAKNFINERIAAAHSAYTLVGIHIRRGDILLDNFKNYGYTTPPVSYFHSSMHYFIKKLTRVVFIVASDDIKWCKENIDNKTFNVIFSEGLPDYMDLAILSMCKHTIVSVGSFGWWAAWLANGTTIYYEKWPKEYSQLEYHVDKNHYFPPHWLPMS